MKCFVQASWTDTERLGEQQALSSPERWLKQVFSAPLYPPGVPSAGGLHIIPRLVGFWGKGVLAGPPQLIPARAANSPG